MQGFNFVGFEIRRVLNLEGLTCWRVWNLEGLKCGGFQVLGVSNLDGFNFVWFEIYWK